MKTETRNRHIIREVDSGKLNYSAAARKYGVSRQYVQQLCSAKGVESAYKRQLSGPKAKVRDAYWKKQSDEAEERAKKIEVYYTKGENAPALATRFDVTVETMRNFMCRWRKRGLFKKRA